jgi:hypothetical protein
VRIDQHGEHAERFVVLDEPHTAHVRGKVIHDIDAFDRLKAGLTQIAIERQILRVAEPLIPLFNWLDIHGTNLVALLEEILYEMAADEPTRACDNDIFRHDVFSFLSC